MSMVWEPPFPFGGAALSTKDEVHSLGILLDPELSMESQIASVLHLAYLHLRWIAQLCPYLDSRSLHPSGLMHWQSQK